jgi:hypothetical protein
MRSTTARLGFRRLSSAQVYEMRCLYMDGVTQDRLARLYEVSQQAVAKILAGRSYRHVPTPVVIGMRMIDGPVPLPWFDIATLDEAIEMGAGLDPDWRSRLGRGMRPSELVRWLDDAPGYLVASAFALPYRATGRPVPELPVTADAVGMRWRDYDMAGGLTGMVDRALAQQPANRCSPVSEPDGPARQLP